MDQQRPLRILTIDGGGLQGLVTLSILKEVCKAIAKQNGAARPPAPHELFDIIGGIGTGGWIALLLGRYRLDIATCMAVYMEIARDVDAEAMGSSPPKRKRPFKLDQNRLVAVVEKVLERYDLEPCMLRGRNERRTSLKDSSSRCKYAFAVGVVQRTNKQATGYELFRSYSTQDVFAATGAAKFFLQPYKIGGTTFFDDTFPQSHPITSIALDEAFGIHGLNVSISVLLNVGPGIPSESDRLQLEEMAISPMTRLARKFSWPQGKHLPGFGKLLNHDSDIPKTRLESQSTLSSSSESILKMEGQRRDDIKQRLQELYGERGAEKYHHLGPDISVDRTSLNDVHAMCNRQPRSAEFRQALQAEAESVVRQMWVESAA